MNLLLLTKFYPYGTGEAFIENEIKVFSEYFEKITIIACEVEATENRMRSLPENVTAFRVPSASKKVDAVKGLKHVLSKDSDIKSGYSECSNFLQKLFLSYFEEKSERIFHYIESQKWLEDVIDQPYMLYSYWLFVTARVGTFISKKKKPVFSFTRTHRYDLYAERNKSHYLPYRNLLLDAYDMIFPCSNDGTRYLQERYPKYADKIQTAFLGTLEHGLGQMSTDGIFRVVSCSRIVDEKRVDRIISALALLDDEKKSIAWTHIGGGIGLDQLKQEAEAKLKHIRFRFLGDTPNIEVMDFYKKNPFDLFVNVSSSEGLPVSIMEAISFGMPVVATDVGGTSEIVINDVTGCLLPEEFTDQQLADAILVYMTMDHIEYAECRSKCRNYWENHFQAIPNYRKLCEHLKQHF